MEQLKKKKKIIFIALSILLICVTSFFVYMIYDKGKTYSFDGQNLTIYKDKFFYSDEKYKFEESPYLKSVVIQDGVEMVPHDSFRKCENLESVSVGRVEYIDMGAFELCTNLKNVTLSEGISMIHMSVFGQCSSLESINIPDSVTDIALPDNLNSIGNGAFAACEKMSEINLPENLTHIGDSAFSSCKSIKSITIPKSVSYIGQSAFYNWTSEQTIYIQGRSEAPSTWNKEWQKNCSAKIVWNA